MKNADLMEIEKYNIDLKNYNIIGKQKKESSTQVNIIQDKNSSKKYVAKTFPITIESQNKQLFLSEIYNLIQIRHPTLVQFKGFSYKDFQDSNNVTILINYMENGSLLKLFEGKMKNINSIEFNTKRQILLVGIAYGMMILQDRNIIYHDLKPGNVLLDDNYQPLLTDFFLSKFKPQTFSLEQHSNINSIAYLAPEIIITNIFNSKSDVYSFGILMYEILTGERAYKKDFESINFSKITFLKKVIEGYRPKFNVPIQKSFENLIEKCWSNDPQKRPTFSEIFTKLSLIGDNKINNDDSDSPILNKNYCLDGVNIDELFFYVNEITSNSTLKIVKKKEKEKLYHTDEICQQIFSLDRSNVSIPQNLDEKSKEFVNLILKSFPKDYEIRSFLKDIKNESIKNFVFPLDDCNDNLKTIFNTKDLFKYQSIFDIFSIYTFYSWISIYTNLKQKFDISNLLKVLNYIIKITSNNNEKTKYHYIAVSCFVEIIKKAIENDSLDNTFSEISDFFVKNKDLPENSDEIIKLLLAKIVTPNNKLSSEGTDFINLISFILNQNPKSLSNQLILSIIKSIKTSIINLNITSLNFFLNAANHIEMENFVEIFKPLLVQLLTNTVIDHNINEELNQEKDENSTQLFQLKIDDFDYFNPPKNLYQIDDVDNTNIITDFKVKDLKSFLNQQIFGIVLLIGKIILLNENYAQFFLSEAEFNLQSLHSSLKDHLLLKRIFYEQCTIVFYLVSSVIKKYSNLTISKLHKYIFDPKITYFTQNSNFDIINSLRDFIFRFLIDYFPISLSEILKEISIFPEIFLESICRILLIKKNSSINFKLTFSADTLITSLCKYRINSSFNKNDENVLILKIRKILLTYFNEFLLNNSIIEIVFSSPTFVECFFSLLIEPPIRNSFISYLQKYLLSITSDSFISENMDKIINKTCVELPQEEAYSLFLSILNSFNESLSKNKSLSNAFIPVASNICLNIKKLQFITFENKDELFYSLIDFLVGSYCNKTIKENHLILLESTFNYFIETIFQTKIMEKIIQIIAGEQLQSISPTFEVKNSKFLCSLVRVFLKTNLVYKVFQFISDLCNYSSSNCIKCHEAELDSLIIEIIDKWRKNIIQITTTDYNDLNNDHIYISERLINVILHLFVQISTTISSIPVINKFFSLLCPIENQYLSLMHGSILNTLNSIFIKSKFSPICVIPMGKDNEIQIKEISSNFFDQGLCFIFWILIPSKIEGYSQNVLVLNDGQEHMLKIKMIGNSLRVVIQSGTVFYSSDFELNIPTNSWKMISISSNPNSNNQGTSITLYINKEKIQDLITFASFSPKAQVECIVNQSKQNPNDFDPPLMGTFILAKQLLKEEIESIYDEGQRSSLSLFSEKIIFAYSEKICENSLSLIPIQKLDKKISESIPKSIQFKTYDSFCDLLINNSKVDLIIPIFAQFDIPLKNGHKLTKDFSIEILMNLFNLSEKAQSSFYQFNGFFAIAYLLQNSDKAHVNYELYIQYSKLLENITFKNLQLQLIDAILMNINLWSKDETKNQAKIFKHWLQNIYNSHKSMVDNVRQIEWFIFIIHRFYNNEDPNSFSCRKSLFEIAIEISKTNVSLKNLFLIIEIICSVKSSIIERKEMLNFLSKIIQNKQTIIESKINISSIIPRLFQIFNLQEKDDDLIIQTISLYIIIYKHKEYNPKTPLFSLIQKIIISLNINQSYIFKEEMFSILISLMNVNKATELLPIISVNAILGGANYLILMIKNIDRKLNYYITKQSIIYPALLLFAYFPNTYLYHEVVRMNISLFKHHWTILVNSINILGYFYFDHNVFDKIKHDILYRLIIQPKIMRIDALAMIRVIKDFIFFRPEKAESSILAKMMNQNIFKDDEISYKSNSESKNSIEEDVDENSDGSEIDISNSSNNNDTINYISNSLPKLNAFGYNQMKISTLPNSFRVRFDLNAVGPVLNTKNASESTLSDDGGFNFEFKDFDEFECDTKIIDIIRNLKEKIENVIKSNPFDASVIFKYKFGMRFSQEDEKWLDLDLAKSTFLLYKSYKDIQYAETMNLLAHFVYKCDHFFINKMKAFFPDLNIYLGEIRKISLYDQMELQLNYHDEMINHQNLLFSNAFVSFYNSILNDQSFSIKTDQNKLFELIYNFENQLEKVNRINKNIWSSLWHSLTIIRAPWSDSISIEKGYKRMNKFCFAFCPYKIQINEHFDKHTKASLMRDLKGTKNSFLISSNNQKERSQNPLFNYEFENLKTSDFVITKSDNKDTLECKLVTIKWEKNALIKFDIKMIIITIVFENKTILIPYSDIHSIMYAYKHQKYSGIQILTKSREEYFVIFQNNFFRSLILRIRYMPQMDINKVQNENPKSFLNSFKITNFWVEGKITNFEYLIFLNILSGRSFNDATQYPIFPWIISDYKSDKLDLNSPSVFRDLSKPIGALNEGRLNELIERMNKMKENNSYLYENCYSNLFIVFYYLIRLEPFTTQLIEINDGKFDDCSLIFKSIEESFENAIKNCSELVPEFFFMPEFLINMNNFDLGKTIDKVTVNDVILPPWSNNSPIEFVYLNRKALESDFVSRNLNKWIDLIWGFKQDGEEAVKANNVFRPEIYETIWKRSDVNEKGIKAVQNNAGQIPLKLFDVKHPERKNQLKKSLLKKSSIFTFSDQNDRQKYSVIKLFEVNRIVSANVSLHSHKNKFYFTVLDNKGTIFVYSVKFKKLNATEIVIKAKKSQNISIDQENRPTICFPKFIDSNFLCFYDKQTLSVKLFDCKSFSLFENIKQNFEVVSIETNQEGFFAISTKDSNMTVYNVHNSIQNSKQSKIQMNSNELKSQFEQDCFFGSPAKISSFKESIICIAIHPTFDALICGTKDNCLLFCQLNMNQMKVIKMIKINGKPQKIIITDVFGFVAVLIKKIKNGEIFEKVILFTINGEKIKTLKIEKDQQIVSMEKAKSMPSGLDFLIMADNNNRIYVFEAFYMKLNEPIFICNSKVLKLTYIKEESLIIAFCEDGTVTIIFYPIIY